MMRLRIKPRPFLALVIAIFVAQAPAQAETFDFTSGTFDWNVPMNWTPDSVPNAPGASAILPSPTGNLSIGLGAPITVGSLEILKPLSPNIGTTSITGSNSLTISGGSATITNRASAAGTGTTTIAVPVQLDSQLTVKQESNDFLQFNESISGGSVGLTVIRSGAGNGFRTIVLGAANTYGGTTVFSGGGNDNDLVVRLGNSNALPALSTIAASNSVIFELAAGDFTRSIGNTAGTGQFQFNGSGQNGWGAIGAERHIRLNNGTNLMNWSLITVNEMVLGTPNSNATTDFQNLLSLNGGVDRKVHTYDGSAAIDGKFSSTLSGNGSLHKLEAGTLSLTAGNTYTGGTTIDGGVLLVNNGSGTGSGTGSGPVTVNAATLGGTGFITGTVTANSGAHIAPGASIESLDVGGLDLKPGSTLDFELAAPGTSDRLNVTLNNGLLIEGGSVNLINAGGLAVGTYTLIDYAGSIMGGAAATAFLNALPTGPAGFTYMLSDTGSTIDLLVGAAGAFNADFNDDHIVDAADYVIWRKHFPTTGTGTHATGDANGDTNINALDYNIWRASFGTGGLGAGSSAGIPEPSTWALLSLASICALRIRGR